MRRLLQTRHTHTHTHAHTKKTHTHAHTHTHAYTHTYTHIHTDTHTHTHTHTCIFCVRFTYCARPERCRPTPIHNSTAAPGPLSPQPAWVTANPYDSRGTTVRVHHGDAVVPVAHVLPGRKYGNTLCIYPIVSLPSVVPAGPSSTPPASSSSSTPGSSSASPGDGAIRDRNPFNASNPFYHITGSETMTTFSADASTFSAPPAAAEGNNGCGGADQAAPALDDLSWADARFATHSLCVMSLPGVTHLRFVLNATGYPEATATRVATLHPDSWLWKPRSEQHVASAYRFEVARKPKVSATLHPAVYVLASAQLTLQSEFDAAMAGGSMRKFMARLMEARR